ncbi:MAG: glutathione S-transferase family protein [Alphaproteobacteria bacterium]|nr:glutathione S-transferase family protein [Alphaproteobacteria bacterium]MBU1516565.1 glutathione S-transferase family protein [Alphaproteobacteria bacterium]MBU2094322.1 glutathione S-transferase family protein [Alphaproteobacteria bacterium]MBU2154101.1 glutathione S-transferase family protein [Alphaproteobacteria bacterium]MBU2307492.1 glutathione S-transferase family protein [Alphaproteobacteria bacterium]
MLEIHAFATPNSVKVVIAAEEMGLPHNLVSVDLRRGEQRSDAFLALNPNGKLPVLIDRSPAANAEVVLSESAAILVHLAEKTGQLLPTDPQRRAKVFEQLFFHASAASPAFLHAFLLEMRKEPEGEARAAARKEVARVLGVLDGILQRDPFVAGAEYTIADIAHFGWIWRHRAFGADLADFPSVKRWHDEILTRPAVAKAISSTLALAG